MHTEHFLLIDKRIRGIYNGALKLEMEKLEEGIKYIKTGRLKHIVDGQLGKIR